MPKFSYNGITLEAAFEPTQEQWIIVDAVVNTSDNIIIKALAGAAKTSTLVLIAQALAQTRMLCLAFNKKIATEMQERLPPNCTAMTLNSLGHRTWSECSGRRLVLEKDKVFKILSDLIKQLKDYEKEAAYEYLADMIKAVDFGKVQGWIPEGQFKQAKRLLSDEEFYQSLEEEPSPLAWGLIRAATIKSLEQAIDGLIDFNDQILMPTLFPAMFTSYPCVLIDESQDLSPLNHATLAKLVKKRIIAVGDECQAIYAFRGAHGDSMNLLQARFNMKAFILSTSFRCPKRVVEAARWRAPHMRWPEWAIDGEVKHVVELWDQTVVPERAAIICRNNAPLFGLAMKLLKNGRYPQIIGNDIGKYLVKVMRKFGMGGMPRNEVIEAIERWRDEKAAKARNPEKVYDQAACLMVFARAEKATTLGEAIAYAEYIFASQGPIQMMTGHKSKGLEYDEVFFLDEHLVQKGNPEQPQEDNLYYVIQTRAKKTLTYVRSDQFFDAEPE